MYAMEAPTPIQYQYASGKIPRDFKICTPSGSVESGGTCNEEVFTCFQTLFIRNICTQKQNVLKKRDGGSICILVYLRYSWDCIACLHGTNYFQGIHSQQ